MILNIRIIFRICNSKLPKKSFAGPKFDFFREFLHIDKSEGADFKYDHSFYKFQSQNTQKGNFWFQS